MRFLITMVPRNNDIALHANVVFHMDLDTNPFNYEHYVLVLYLQSTMNSQFEVDIYLYLPGNNLCL